MKNFTLLLILFSAIFNITACSQNKKNIVSDYQPTNPGTYWKYKIELGGGPTEELTETVEPGTVNFQGKVYNKTIGRSKSTDSLRIFYYAKSGGKYYVRTSLSPQSAYDLNAEIMYLDESQPAGSKWAFLTDSSKMFKITGNCAVLEKGTSKTINGQLFKDVIHSRATLSIAMKMGEEMAIPGDLNLDVSNLGQTFTIDFYVAKGVGVIETGMASSAAPQAIVKQTILSYDIK